jgi:hypothetical protein
VKAREENERLLAQLAVAQETKGNATEAVSCTAPSHVGQRKRDRPDMLANIRSVPNSTLQGWDKHTIGLHQETVSPFIGRETLCR